MKKVIIPILVMASFFAFSQNHPMNMPAMKQGAKKESNSPTRPKTVSEHNSMQSNTLPLSRIIAQKLVKPTGKIVEYDLYVAEKEVNYSGKKAIAIAINGGIPGPTLRFTEGDSAIVRVHNQLTMMTSVHWHGLLLPNRQDGVPFLTTPPINAGETYTFQFPIVQSGTYWYHAHDLQEQIGVYGAIVIEPQKKSIKVDKDIVLVLSEWTDESPESILKNLKRRNEWYSVRKNTVQSLDRVIKNKAVGAYLKQSFNRMNPMDLSDILYDKFLINGLNANSLEDLKPNERVRVRVINAGSSTYFHVNYAGGAMEMVSADGVDVEPVKVNHRLMGMGETYDFILTIPNDMAYEFRATAQDGSGYASYFLGKGMKMAAPAIPKPNLYEMTRAMSSMNMGSDDMKGMDMGETDKKSPEMKGMDMGKTDEKSPDMKGMDMGKTDEKSPEMKGMDMGKTDKKSTDMKGMDMKSTKKKTKKNSDMKAMDMKDMETKHTDTERMDMGLGEYYGIDYNILKSTEPIIFPTERPLREVKIKLTGDMRRYIWEINGKPVSRESTIMIRRGEIVRFKLINTTMMFHPMHLHGHFFRVLNSQGEYSPIKHTVNVAPMESVTIEFLADDEKNWFFHCHLLYHMATGMARIVSYEGDKPDADIALMTKQLKKSVDDNVFYFWGTAEVSVTNNYLNLNYSNNRNAFILGGDANWKGDYEIDLDYERYLTKYFRVFGGIDAGNELFLRKPSGDLGTNIDAKIIRPVVGIRYLLPFLIESEVKFDSRGNVRFQLSGEQRLTRRLGLGLQGQWLVDGYTRLHVDLDYILNKSLSLFANYDTRYKNAGGGLSIKF